MDSARVCPPSVSGTSTAVPSVESLTSGNSLRGLRAVFDEEQVSVMREAIDTADERDRDEARRVSERFE